MLLFFLLQVTGADHPGRVLECTSKAIHHSVMANPNGEIYTTFYLSAVPRATEVHQFKSQFVRLSKFSSRKLPNSQYVTPVIYLHFLDPLSTPSSSRDPPGT